jgi:foldase protein PrsA
MNVSLLAGLVAAACLFSSPARGAQTSTSPLFNDVVLARGQGVEVRRGQLDDAFIAFRANLSARGQNLPEEKRLPAEAQLLDRLVISQVLSNKATSADKAKAAEKATKFLDDSFRQAGSSEAFVRQIKVMGITPQQLTNRIVEQAIAEELIGREIRSKILISPEQIQQYYETNDAAFHQPETARASHILIFTRDVRTRLELPDDQKKAKLEKAEKALARARKGEDFTKLVVEYSEDPMVKENKGEYNFTRAKDDPRRAMVPECESVLFSLRPGEISNLVKPEYGFQIIKLHEITPSRKVPLAEVRDRVKDLLTNQELDGRLPAYFAKLKAEASVEILDERLKEVLAKLEQETKK